MINVRGNTTTIASGNTQKSAATLKTRKKLTRHINDDEIAEKSEVSSANESDEEQEKSKIKEKKIKEKKANEKTNKEEEE